MTIRNSSMTSHARSLGNMFGTSDPDAKWNCHYLPERCDSATCVEMRRARKIGVPIYDGKQRPNANSHLGDPEMRILRRSSAPIRDWSLCTENEARLAIGSKSQVSLSIVALGHLQLFVSNGECCFHSK